MEGVMITLNATEARKSFFDIIKRTNQQHEIVEVQHKNGKSVIMSSEEYESLQETLHLLSQEGFAKAFKEAVEEANSGKTDSFDNVFGESL
jgi:antitoxin YefM